MENGNEDDLSSERIDFGDVYRYVYLILTQTVAVTGCPTLIHTNSQNIERLLQRSTILFAILDANNLDY